MLMEFYDPSQSIFNVSHKLKLHIRNILILLKSQDKSIKSLKDVLESKPEAKETILENLKTVLLTCIQKYFKLFKFIFKICTKFCSLLKDYSYVFARSSIIFGIFREQ